MSMINVLIENVNIKALLDSGSCENFLAKSVLRLLPQVKLYNIAPITVTMAHEAAKVIINQYCILNLECLLKSGSRKYTNVRVLIMPDSFHSLILGLPFFKLHNSVQFETKGNLPMLQVCSLKAVSLPSVNSPFRTLTDDVRPVITRSRSYSQEDVIFIKGEVDRLLTDGIIEVSCAPWRAQCLVVVNNAKKRLVIDYSQTIKRFTLPDAYPIPNIEKLINAIAENKYFSQLDLKSAYHQLPLAVEDRAFTAFEANGKLYQFKRLAFGLTNGVACFQRLIDGIVDSQNLKRTYPYLDDNTVAGRTSDEHDENVEKFLLTAKQHGLTLNKDKCVFRQTSVKLLGYLVSHNCIKPDPDRLQALLDIRMPTTPKELERLRGLLAYYARWLPKFSERIAPLTNASLPLAPALAQELFALIKELGNASKCRIDPCKVFTLESDASYDAIAATLTQDGKPVAFFSRTLSSSERNHSSVEKEAYAIVESIRRWSHLLLAKRFTVVTDQRSVSFMFDQTHKSSIKNDKIARWRLELMPYTFEIKYRPGPLNVPADALSRKSIKKVSKKRACKSKKLSKVIHVTSLSSSSISKAKLVHDEYSHPGVTRFWAIVKQLNIAVTLEEVREICKNCPVCAKVKPKFAKIAPGKLVQAMRPWDRISLDFKGPLTNTSVGNRFLLIMVDEYSRYPFAFPCKEASAESVIKCLKSVIALFGAPRHVHSDRGTAFMAASVKEFLFKNGINSNHSTPYHPVGNSQCERYVGIVWKTVTLELEQNRLSIHQWDTVVETALASIRALINTSTNETPHNRMFAFERTRVFNDSDYVEAEKVMYLRKFVRNKSEPLVAEKVTIINYNQTYSDILHADGRHDRVSNNDLSPCPNMPEVVEEQPPFGEFLHVPVPIPDNFEQTTPAEEPVAKPREEAAASTTPRRSSRLSRPPDRLNL